VFDVLLAGPPCVLLCKPENPAGNKAQNKAAKVQNPPHHPPSAFYSPPHLSTPQNKPPNTKNARKTPQTPQTLKVGVVGALSAFYSSTSEVHDPAQQLRACMRLISKMPTLAALAYKTSRGMVGGRLGRGACRGGFLGGFFRGVRGSQRAGRRPFPNPPSLPSPSTTPLNPSKPPTKRPIISQTPTHPLSPSSTPATT
jgi:hypothetical protein